MFIQNIALCCAFCVVFSKLCMFCYTVPVTFHHSDVTYIDHDMHFDTYTGINICVIFFTNINYVWFVSVGCI